MISGQDDDSERVRLLIRAHDRSGQLRSLLARSAPLLNLKLRIIRAQKLLLFPLLPVVLVSVFLVFLAEGVWFAVGLGGLFVAFIHVTYLLVLLRMEKALIRKKFWEQFRP